VPVCLGAGWQEERVVASQIASSLGWCSWK
jgi:hypothetical protein